MPVQILATLCGLARHLNHCISLPSSRLIGRVLRDFKMGVMFTVLKSKVKTNYLYICVNFLIYVFVSTSLF